MNTGLISIPLLIISGLVTIIVTGGSFAVYEYVQVVEEKQALETELVAEKNKEIEALKAELDSSQQINATSSTETQIINDNAPTQTSNIQPEIREVVRTVTEYVPVEVPASQSEDSGADNSPEDVLTETALKVTNVKERLNEDDYSIRITWETTINADSRLVTDNRTFSSANSDSKEHSIEIVALPASQKIDYEIIAEVGDKKDSHFGGFQAPREFEVTFDEGSEDECTTVVIKDTAGYPLENTFLKLSSYYTRGLVNVIGKTVREYTNSRGEIEYCDPIERFWVQNIETGDIYYDTR